MNPKWKLSAYGIAASALWLQCAGCGHSEVAASKASQSQDEPTVRIVKPSPGTSLEPGSTFDVLVEVPTEFAFRDGLLIEFHGDARSFTSAPFAATFTVPESVAGHATVNTIGVLKNGTPVGATIEVDVKPSAALVGLEFSQKQLVIFSSHPEKTIRLIGVYQDGRHGALHPTVPVTMTVDDAAVASVDNHGKVLAKAPGDTLLRVTAGGITATLPVIVRAEF